MSRPDHHPPYLVHKADQEPTAQRLIIYAGSSWRRLNALIYLLGGKNGVVVTSEPPRQDEPRDEDTRLVTLFKTHCTYDQLRESGTIPKSPFSIIAGDIRQRVMRLEEEQKVSQTKSKGKPQGLSNVRDSTIARLYGYSKSKYQPEPYYTIDASSSIWLPSGIQSKLDPTTITLNREALQRISTPQGFNLYWEEADRFLSSSIYRENGLYPPQKLTDIAGGLELATLAHIGVVRIINGIDISSEKFRQVLQSGLYNALIGLSPDLLRKFDPHVEDRIVNWPWLQRITSYAMGEVNLAA